MRDATGDTTRRATAGSTPSETPESRRSRSCAACAFGVLAGDFDPVPDWKLDLRDRRRNVRGDRLEISALDIRTDVEPTRPVHAPDHVRRRLHAPRRRCRRGARGRMGVSSIRSRTLSGFCRVSGVLQTITSYALPSTVDIGELFGAHVGGSGAAHVAGFHADLLRLVEVHLDDEMRDVALEVRYAGRPRLGCP